MCLFPTRVTRQEYGRPKPDPEGDLKIPCGKCNPCLRKRALDWALRARHEISLHKQNCSVTLTYDDQHLKSIFTLKDQFQNFMKKLRKYTNKKINYMVSHEYGTKTFRPHHHVILFNYSPEDLKFLKLSPKGEKLFTSKELDKIWKNGFHAVGDANEKTAYYIAAYALKGKKHKIVDQLGEEHDVSDSYDCSKRPAIGLEYFKNNYKQLIDSNERLPRYYRKKLEFYTSPIDQRPRFTKGPKKGEVKDKFLIPIEYLQNIENNLASKSLDHSTQDRLAKLIISHASESQNQSEFRSAPRNEDQFYASRAYLKKETYLIKELQHETIHNSRSKNSNSQLPSSVQKC